MLRPGHDQGGVLVGRELCEIVTTGMYTNPLAFYREYIQNSVDAFGDAGEVMAGTIRVSIDVRERSVTIADNGPGIGRTQAVRALVPIGSSDKRRGMERGFRGIGRLSALAFADRVRFRTRSGGEQAVTEVTWDGERLRERLRDTRGASEVIRGCVEVGEVNGSRYPDQFFEVQVEGVHHHAAGRVLNSVAVRDYVGEACPVPLKAEFPFSMDVEALLANELGMATVRVLVNGEDPPVTRPFGSEVRFSASRKDDFVEFEAITVPALGSTRHSAIGWVAHTRYLGALPAQARIRGLRIRMGNIQLGGEGVFDALFPDPRFNRWCVGEVHVVDPRLVPNARRDYLEAGPHTRNLENHLRAVCRRIARRCRDASRGRLRERKVLTALQEAEDGLRLAASGYLAQDQAKEIVSRVVEDLRRVGRAVDALGIEGLTGRMRVLVANAVEFEVPGNALERQGVSPVEAEAYRRCFGAIVGESPSPGAASRLIETIVAALTESDE